MSPFNANFLSTGIVHMRVSKYTPGTLESQTFMRDRSILPIHLPRRYLRVAVPSILTVIDF